MQPDPHTPKRELSDEQLLAQREEEIARVEELIATMERKLEWEISHKDELIAQEVKEAKEDLRTKIKEDLRGNIKESLRAEVMEDPQGEVKEELRDEMVEELRAEMQEDLRKEFEKLEKEKKEIERQRENLRQGMELMDKCRLLSE